MPIYRLVQDFTAIHGMIFHSANNFLRKRAALEAMIPHAEHPEYATGAAKRQGLGGLLKHGIVMINLKSGEFSIYSQKVSNICSALPWKHGRGFIMLIVERSKSCHFTIRNGWFHCRDTKKWRALVADRSPGEFMVHNPAISTIKWIMVTDRIMEKEKRST